MTWAPEEKNKKFEPIFGPSYIKKRSTYIFRAIEIHKNFKLSAGQNKNFVLLITAPVWRRQPFVMASQFVTTKRTWSSARTKLYGRTPHHYLEKFNAQDPVNRSKARPRMMASLTASTDKMKEKVPSTRQTLTMKRKIGLRRSKNHVQTKQGEVIVSNIVMVKTGEDALEINQIDVYGVKVSFS